LDLNYRGKTQKRHSFVWGVKWRDALVSTAHQPDLSRFNSVIR